VTASVSYVKADNSYNMNMTSLRTGRLSDFNYKLEAKQVGLGHIVAFQNYSSTSYQIHE
jgi:hypothetical protein